jgi:uncharacterized integral membrane protein
VVDAAGRGAGEGPDTRRHDVRMVLIGVAAVLLVWFALANLQNTPIHFWVTTTRAPLIVVIAIAGAFGAVIGALVARRRRKPRDGVQDL